MSRLFFRKENRLAQSADFSQVFAEGKKIVGHFLVLYQKENALGRVRLGIITSKKQAKSAVDRNRIRRLVREYIRLNQQIIPAKDFVIVARLKATHATHNELTRCLAWLIKQ